MAAMFAGLWLMMKMFTAIFSVEKGETPDMEMTASATDGSTIEDEWIAYYVDDYTAYEMLYTDSDYLRRSSFEENNFIIIGRFIVGIARFGFCSDYVYREGDASAIRTV